MSENILEIRELSKDYGDFVLDKISFSLPRGVIMGLIGENVPRYEQKTLSIT